MSDDSMPPCCGSGCAVCVLDYWEGVATDDRGPAVTDEPEAALAEAACCGSGCTVCVRDYTELTAASTAGPTLTELIEAVEAAERSLSTASPRG